MLSLLALQIAEFKKHRFLHDGSDISKKDNIDKEIKYLYIWYQLRIGAYQVNRNQVEEFIYDNSYNKCYTGSIYPYSNTILETVEMKAVEENNYEHFRKISPLSQIGLNFYIENYDKEYKSNGFSKEEAYIRLLSSKKELSSRSIKNIKEYMNHNSNVKFKNLILDRIHIKEEWIKEFCKESEINKIIELEKLYSSKLSDGINLNKLNSLLLNMNINRNALILLKKIIRKHLIHKTLDNKTKESLIKIAKRIIDSKTSDTELIFLIGYISGDAERYLNIKDIYKFYLGKSNIFDFAYDDLTYTYNVDKIDKMVILSFISGDLDDTLILALSSSKKFLYDLHESLQNNKPVGYIDKLLNSSIPNGFMEFFYEKMPHIMSIRGIGKDKIIIPKMYKPFTTLPSILIAIIREESKFNHSAIGTIGDFGIAQITPASYLDYLKRVEKYNGIIPSQNELIDKLRKMNMNEYMKVCAFILLSKMYILNRMLSESIYDRSLVILIGSIFAYNAGEGNAINLVKRYTKNNKFNYVEALLTSGYDNTSKYTRRVIRNIGVQNKFNCVNNSSKVINEFLNYVKSLFQQNSKIVNDMIANLERL